MAELKPWLDKDHIRSVVRAGTDQLFVHFLDGTKHVYTIDDCDAGQVAEILIDLKEKGIPVGE